MNFLGLHTHYELDRIIGRQGDLEQQNKLPPKAVALSEKRRLDLFTVARMTSWVKPVVDASYGSSSFVPAKDGDVWELRISTTGLLFRLHSPEK